MKIDQARAANLGVIYCIGENLEEWEADIEIPPTHEVVSQQLMSIKPKLDETNWNKVIIAYEPIWALNTGKIASADQIQE